MDKKQAIQTIMQLKNTCLDVDYVEKLIYNNIVNNEYRNDSLDFNDIMNKYGKFDDGHYTAYHYINSFGEICKDVYLATVCGLKEVTDEDLLEIHGVGEARLLEMKQAIREFAESFVENYNSIQETEESIEDYFDQEDNKYTLHLLCHKGIENEDFVGNVFANFMMEKYMSKFVSDTIMSLTEPFVQAFNEFSYEDCQRSLFNVNGQLAYNRYYDIVSTGDLLRQRPNSQGKLVSLVNTALADKVRSIIDNEYNQEIDDNNRTFNNFAKSMGRRFRPNDIENVCDKMMEYFVQQYYSDEIDRGLVKKFAEKPRTGSELRHIFDSLHNAINFNLENRSMEFIISQMCDYVPEYLEEKLTKNAIDQFVENEDNMLSYLRSKSGDVVNQKRLASMDHCEENKKTHIQAVIESMDDDKKQEVEEIVLQYVRDKFADMDGRRLARGVLSEDFIKAHKRELIKIVSNSNYNDNAAMNMIVDIMKGNVVEDIFEDEDFDM